MRMKQHFANFLNQLLYLKNQYFIGGALGDFQMIIAGITYILVYPHGVRHKETKPELLYNNKIKQKLEKGYDLT